MCVRMIKTIALFSIEHIIMRIIDLNSVIMISYDIIYQTLFSIRMLKLQTFFVLHSQDQSIFHQIFGAFMEKNRNEK